MEIIKTESLQENEIIKKAIETLRNGGILIYPTETTYGMGVDATNTKAVEKLLDYKEKREGKALSIAVSDIEMAQNYVDLNDIAKNIYKNFLPGPITVISKSKGIVAENVESSKGTLGIRIPNYPLILKIIKKFGKGITATSANASNKKRPYTIQDILENISNRQKSLIDLVIDAGELPRNNPSTVIDTVSGEIETVRIGDQRFDLSKVITSKKEEDTVNIGEKLGKYLKEKHEKPVVIAIQGDLGAGKTHFAQGVAKGLGIHGVIKSPTFILSNEYDIPSEYEKKFFHIDTYRMEKEEELLDIGYTTMLSKPNVILIEWANRVIPVLDKNKDGVDFIWLRFEHDNENSRRIYHNLDILN